MKKWMNFGLMYVLILYSLLIPLNTVSAEDTSGNNEEQSEKKSETQTEKEGLADYQEGVSEAINDVSDYIQNVSYATDWQAIGLIKAGKPLPDSYASNFEEHVENQITEGLYTGRFKITDAERLTIAAVALGEDPRDIQGHDLIELIYNSPDRMMGSEPVYTMTFQGNNGPIFALVALDTQGFNVPKDARWTRQDLIDELLKTQNDDGSWHLSELFDSPSIDITSMAIIGLAPYKDQPKVQEAIKKTITYLSDIQNEDGGFEGGSFVGGVTSEATSQTIIGLSAYGLDPTDDRFTKNGNNLIDHLLSFQSEDGGFKHTQGDSQSNEMGTEQALQGLLAYKLFLEGKKPLYQFDAVKNEPEEPEDNKNNEDDESKDETPPEITVDGIPDNGVSESSKITITVSAEDDVDGKVVPSIKVNDEALDTQKNGEYIVQLHEGTNHISITAKDQADNLNEETYKVKYHSKEVTPDKKTEVHRDEKIAITDSHNTELKLPSDLPKGTKVTINKSAKKYAAMKAVGDVFNFDFEYPKGEKRGTKEFRLTMGVNPNENPDPEKTGIYHLNKQTNRWEYAGGKGELRNGKITINVTHSSTYGIFTDNEGPSDIQLTGKKITSNSIILGLSAYDPSGIKSYTIYRDGVEKLLDGKETEFTDTGLEAESKYEYTVKVVDMFENESEQSITLSTNEEEDGIGKGNIEDRNGDNPSGNENLVPTNNVEKDVDNRVDNNTSVNDTSETLPDTSTNIFNILLIGALLLILGVIFLIIRQKRVAK